MKEITNSRDADACRATAVEAVKRLQDAGHTAYWAGGCVRDILLGAVPKDYDIATGARPDDVMRLFPDSTAVGKAFAVVRAPHSGVFFDIATFRKDDVYLDGRRPSAVQFVDAATDASRRDFTVNAMFYDPVSDELHDHVGGRADLDARIIRAVGDPEERFAEDHLRLLRAARFAATLDFTVEQSTAEAIRTHAASIQTTAPERIREEVVRLLLESGKPGNAIVLLYDLGLLEPIIPEVCAMRGVEQPPEYHPEGDVYEHTVLMLNLMETQRSVALTWSALLHDVGKPPTMTLGPDRIRFHGHAARSAELSEEIMRRLRFSSADVETVAHCIRNHMRVMDVQKMRESTLKKLIAAPTFPVELELHRLDCLASHGGLDNYDFLVAHADRLSSQPILPDPWATGHDVMKMGVPEGPAVGEWLEKAYDAQLEERFKGRDELLAWVRAEIGELPPNRTSC
ncbi:MAG: CCA tRNA nucleotidyltransferase [Lentisphaerae bacterium]|nr:CCA tRNA nucleotidyltransferase [Lentisphaerota bacterium]